MNKTLIIILVAIGVIGCCFLLPYSYGFWSFLEALFIVSGILGIIMYFVTRNKE